MRSSSSSSSSSSPSRLFTRGAGSDRWLTRVFYICHASDSFLQTLRPTCPLQTDSHSCKSADWLLLSSGRRRRGRLRGGPRRSDDGPPTVLIRNEMQKGWKKKRKRQMDRRAWKKRSLHLAFWIQTHVRCCKDLSKRGRKKTGTERNETLGDTGYWVLLVEPDMKMETMLRTSAAQHVTGRIRFIRESLNRTGKVKWTLLDLWFLVPERLFLLFFKGLKIHIISS